jgi:hypothetical protein
VKAEPIDVVDKFVSVGRQEAVWSALGGVQANLAHLDQHAVGFETEPLPATSTLIEESRIVASPHSAALSEDTLIAAQGT